MLEVRRLATFLLASLGTSGLVRADVLHVGPGEPYAEISAAIAAAADRDVILVEPGLYADLDVVNKSISVIGVGRDAVTVLTTSGATVSSLAAGKCVVLANLTIEMPPHITPTPSALFVSGCLGSVRVDNCYVFGSENSWYPGPAASVSSSGDVVFTRCALEGGYGQDGNGDGSDGGGGIAIGGSSRVALYDCLVAGGDGGDHGNCWGCIGGDGGPGAYITSTCYLFASGSTFSGGSPGSDGDYWGGGSGYGIDRQSGSTVLLLDSNTSSSNGGVQLLPGRSYRLSAITPADSKTAHRFSIQGDPGDAIYVLESDRPAFGPMTTELSGVLCADAALASDRPIAVLAGTIQVFHLPLAALPAGVSNARRFVQVVVEKPNGVRTLSGPIALDVLR